MRAITLDPYWAWAIAYGEKRIENRTWTHNHRGSLVIHAGMGRDSKREAAAIEAIRSIDPASLATPEQVDMIRGKIVATCEMLDVVPVDDTASPWAFGPYCFLLGDVQLIMDPVHKTGKLGIWECGEL